MWHVELTKEEVMALYEVIKHYPEDVILGVPKHQLHSRIADGEPY